MYQSLTGLWTEGKCSLQDTCFICEGSQEIGALQFLIQEYLRRHLYVANNLARYYFLSYMHPLYALNCDFQNVTILSRHYSSTLIIRSQLKALGATR